MAMMKRCAEMLDYQIAVILFFALWLLSVGVIALIELAIKKHKAKKEAFAELIRENEMLKRKLNFLELQTELKEVHRDVQ